MKKWLNHRFAECYFLTLRKPYFFTFDLQTFSTVLRQYLVLHVPMWHISWTFLYFFNLFHLIEFSWIIQIITASHSNNEKNEWENDIHVI